jgi:NADPH2:quinone reductase
MHAIVMTAVGGPEVLRPAEIAEPELGPRDVRVAVRAAGVNPIDYKLRSRGTIRGSLPAVLGWDGAGIVDRVGPDVTRFQPGDEVYFCDGGFGPAQRMRTKLMTQQPEDRPRQWPGTYAEAKVLDERLVASKPKRLSFIEAAAAPLVTRPGRRSGEYSVRLGKLHARPGARTAPRPAAGTRGNRPDRIALRLSSGLLIRDTWIQG